MSMLLCVGSEPVFEGQATKNAPVPIQGQMRENTSAVPPCLTDQSPPTSFECRHTRSPLTLALRRAILMGLFPRPRSARPRRSICRFAATRVSANALDLCACAAGLISASTVYSSIPFSFFDCQRLYKKDTISPLPKYGEL